MAEFKQDQQIMQRPKCANPTCEEGALVLIGDKFYCGQCVTKLYEKQNKMIFEQMSTI